MCIPTGSQECSQICSRSKTRNRGSSTRTRIPACSQNHMRKKTMMNCSNNRICSQLCIQGRILLGSWPQSRHSNSPTKTQVCILCRKTMKMRMYCRSNIPIYILPCILARKTMRSPQMSCSRRNSRISIRLCIPNRKSCCRNSHTGTQARIPNRKTMHHTQKDSGAPLSALHPNLIPKSRQFGELDYFLRQRPWVQAKCR
jgi:hypothetical protein